MDNFPRRAIVRIPYEIFLNSKKTLLVLLEIFIFLSLHLEVLIRKVSAEIEFPFCFSITMWSRLFGFIGCFQEKLFWRNLILYSFSILYLKLLFRKSLTYSEVVFLLKIKVNWKVDNKPLNRIKFNRLNSLMNK